MCYMFSGVRSLFGAALSCRAPQGAGIDAGGTLKPPRSVKDLRPTSVGRLVRRIRHGAFVEFAVPKFFNPGARYAHFFDTIAAFRDLTAHVLIESGGHAPVPTNASAPALETSSLVTPMASNRDNRWYFCLSSTPIDILSTLEPSGNGLPLKISLCLQLVDFREISQREGLRSGHDQPDGFFCEGFWTVALWNRRLGGTTIGVL